MQCRRGPGRAMAHAESLNSVWLIFLLISGPLVSVRAGAERRQGCDGGCPLETYPVCGTDGEWYQNGCLATCADLDIDETGKACEGNAMPFDDAKPGPNGAESGGGPESIKLVATSIINAFRQDGLRYVGRIRLAREMGPRPPRGAAADTPEPDSDGRGNWRVDAVRCTAEGDVYRGTMLVPMKASEISAAEPRALQSWFKPGRLTAGSAAADAPQLVQESGSYPPVSEPPAQPHTQPQRPLGFVFSAIQSAVSGLSAMFARPVDPVPVPANSRLPAAAAAAAAVAADTTGDNALLQATDRSSSSSSSRGAGAASVLPDSSRSSAAGSSQQQQQQVSDDARARAESSQEDFELLAELLADPAVANAANATSTDSDSSGSSSSGGHHRRLLEIIGADNRFDCERSYPYTAIGQIQVVDNTGLYICTGTLIRPDKVLTAAHCVWNTKRNAFYYNLNFSPGRYRDGEGMVNPWGIVPWKSVTVFDAFKKNPATWDVAVVTLSKKLGSLTGYMGMAAGCSSQTSLTVAGYPQDQPQGTCMANVCRVPYLDCNALTNTHTCDTIMGMSGSPLWDNKNRIRMIHVAGIAGKDENRATTVTQFLVNTISKW